jgi:outer membrane receptor protein involved in Fe transport
MDQSSFTLAGGGFETWRALAIVSPQLQGTDVLFAGQVFGTNGPFDAPEKLKRYSLQASVSQPLGEHSRFTLAATGYSSGWDASGQIPLRAVQEGLIDPFGSIDSFEGGSSSRQSLSATWSTFDKSSDASVSAYVVHYKFDLFSDFTFFSLDPIDGDMIEQTDARVYEGMDAHYRFQRTWAGIGFDTKFGAQLRSDDIDNGLFKSPERVRLETVNSSRINETSAGVYVSEGITLNRKLRLLVGLRADHYNFGVVDLLGNGRSGVKQASLVSPKASLVYAVEPATELFANYGSGFHSNDARGVVSPVAPVTPLTPARGYELGARSKLFDRIDLTTDVFMIYLDSETVWNGDEGTTEADGPTRRIGFEASAKAKVFSWLNVDADATWTHARFVENAGNGNAVALAPTFLASAGAVVKLKEWFGRLGMVHVADRPATEDGALVALGFTRFDLVAGYKSPRFEISGGIQNLLNAQWREAQFASTSRLPTETSAADCKPPSRAPPDNTGAFMGCEDVHFTPGAPRNLQVAATVFF